jgi:hypothetical protein
MKLLKDKKTGLSLTHLLSILSRFWQDVLWQELSLGFLLAFYAAVTIYQRNSDLTSDYNFYKAIINFTGSAPEQYRIFPYLIIGFIAKFFTINKAFFLFNILFLFLNNVLVYKILKTTKKEISHVIVILLGFLYPQVTNISITAFILCVVSAIVFVYRLSAFNAILKIVLCYLLTLALSFSRSDIALFMALFLSGYLLSNKTTKSLFIITPVLSQLLLQFIIFPNAKYYCNLIMVTINLSTIALKMPINYVLIGILIVFYGYIKKFILYCFYCYRFFMLLFLGYLVTCFFIAIIYEYKLYFPFVPVFLMIYNDCKKPLHEV